MLQTPGLFRTVVPIAPQNNHHALRHHEPLTLLGSCFSDSVGSRLQSYGHSTVINPLGVIYNPVSLARAVELFSQESSIKPEDLHFCERQQHYFSFDAGTVHCHEDADMCAEALSAAIHRGRASLESTSCLFLTLGTAWAYVRPGAGPVACCHRQPQATFERTLLGVDTIESSLRSCISTARSVNPDLRVVLTVSPVRHWREGAVESSRSKAHLVCAAHAVCEAVPEAAYFPSYEILMDELRDYRFYAEDMLHPSDVAIDYVTQRLLETRFDARDDPIREAVKRMRAARSHRHARPRSAAARQFAVDHLTKVTELRDAHPYLDLEEERRHFEDLLS